MPQVFLSLGSNLGDRLSFLEQAIHALQETVTLQKLSSVYETQAWGKTDEPAYYNQIIQISTSLSAKELLVFCQSIETQLGRVRLERWSGRTIDIDIIYYSTDIICTPTLTVPHPSIEKRKFILIPLVELAPAFIHPVWNTTSLQLLEKCSDTLEVKKISC
ncbi:MAG: 2-amino-4-hydroxy-6-hydroxymethyldihydropteridine diphosphokinase [Cytophagaceae bacterium]|nr:2-amino-4-hydroxy-6-hydroxymethyldihydropteridine diphosphokinase [Cytophagaceae bacterium]